ncbi:hypothetical protein roselon_02180 [Roseibacterium elongatum DSM 19469]|uniref:Uncharacterized protein n=1 Tax=Roseicyclus elongatus DSM 19469 TaxID=1294273 RepID=W8RTL8_9RHOB|nr:hypothetical protein [Roseibacterium elongatum]AHM04523.1 hypothetical protein roselon_02180 [Roseibacterium elongatum DSM 19469]
MKPRLPLLIMAFPTAGRAQFTLLQMTGDCQGEGIYADGTESARLRCQLQIDGSDTRVAGRPGRAEVILRGASATEAAIIHFGLNGDGTLPFAAEQTLADGRIQSSVLLSPR